MVNVTHNCTNHLQWLEFYLVQTTPTTTIHTLPCAQASMSTKEQMLWIDFTI